MSNLSKRLKVTSIKMTNNEATLSILSNLNI